MEPKDLQTLVEIAGAFGGAKMATKLLGPTLEYFGKGLKEFTEKRFENVKSIFLKAAKRFPTKDEDELTAANPNLVKTVLDYGSYTEDALIQEYLAGLLISSRIGMNNDNRSAVYAKLIENLSVYQIRTHYLIYTLFRKKYLGMNISINIQVNRSKLQFYIPFSIFERYVLSSDEEKTLSNSLVDHSIHGLVRNYLIEQNLVIGSPEHIAAELKTNKPKEHGIVIQPSVFGIELFLWVSSIGKDIQINKVLDPNIFIPELVDFSKININDIYPCP